MPLKILINFDLEICTFLFKSHYIYNASCYTFCLVKYVHLGIYTSFIFPLESDRALTYGPPVGPWSIFQGRHLHPSPRFPRTDELGKKLSYVPVKTVACGLFNLKLWCFLIPQGIHTCDLLRCY